MKQVMEQYASAVVAVLIATAIIAIIIGGSLGAEQALGPALGQVLGHSVSGKNFSQNPEFDSYMSTAAPSISCKTTYVVANQKTLLADCWQAYSYNGKSLPVYLRKAWSESGAETDLGLSPDGTSICVPKPGVYWLQVYAVDEKQKETCIQMKLLVNER